MSIWTRSFWEATGERAAKTFAQSAGAVLVSGQGLGLFDADLTVVLSTAGLATVLSVLSSIASSGVGGPGPSLATEKLPPPA